MATYRELTYMVLDEIKAISDDATITEEHILFLLNQYKNYIIKQKIKEEGAKSLNQSYYQTLCLNMEYTSLIPDSGTCSEGVLKSKEAIPDIMSGTTIKAYPINYLLGTHISIVSADRFKFVGHNKYMQNIIYLTLNEDNHIYGKSNNAQFQYLKQIQIKGIFDDASKAAELSCDSKETTCDVMDQDFPLESALIPTLIGAVVKELAEVISRPQDDKNNASDDMASLLRQLQAMAASKKN